VLLRFEFVKPEEGKFHCSRFQQIPWYGFFTLERVHVIHCYAALDLGTGDQQPFNCRVQNRQAVQSMRRPMDWSVKDNT